MPTQPHTFDEIMHTEALPVLAIDELSTITYSNGAFARAFGWTSDELVGHPLAKLMPAVLKAGHAIGIDHSLAQWPANSVVQHEAFAVLKKDGSEQGCEQYIIGKKQAGRWQYAALITPTSPAA